MSYSLLDGDDFVEIEYQSKYYFKKGTFPVGTPFTLQGNPITPSVVSEVEADGASTVTTKSKNPIIDTYGHQYEEIVGGRPASRPRR